jgi:hypothetical protein
MKEHKNPEYYFQRIGEESFLIAPRGKLVTIFDKYGHVLKPRQFLQELEDLPPEAKKDPKVQELIRLVEKQSVTEDV